MTKDELLAALDSAELHQLVVEFLDAPSFRKALREVVQQVVVEVEAAKRANVAGLLVAYCLSCGVRLADKGGELVGRRVPRKQGGGEVPEDVKSLVRLYRREILDYLRTLRPCRNGHARNP